MQLFKNLSKMMVQNYSLRNIDFKLIHIFISAEKYLEKIRMKILQFFLLLSFSWHFPFTLTFEPNIEEKHCSLQIRDILVILGAKQRSGTAREWVKHVHYM